VISQDVRYAVRGLGIRPGFAAMVVIILALGIGANAAMFGILDRLLLRAPAHIIDPDRLVQIHTHDLGSTSVQTSQPYRMYKDLLQGVSDFQQVAVATSSTAIGRVYYPLGRGPSATRVAGVQVTPSFFPTLGVRPYLGRFFQDEEAGENNPQKLVVLGFGFWQARFGGRREAIGQTIELGEDRYTIVGVAPRGFTGTGLSDVDVWIPIAAADGLRFAKGADWRTTRTSQWLNIYARLAPNARAEHALAKATAVIRAGEAERIAATNGLDKSSPDSVEVMFGSVIPGRSPASFGLSAKSSEFRVSRLLAAVSIMVLLLACANVANLLLVRALNRRREIAVRLALGITRPRLIGQLVTEGLVLSTLGALGALVVVWLGSGFIRQLLLADATWSGSAVDARVLLFTGVVALGTGILITLVPAAQTMSPDLTSALKTGAREGGASGSFVRSTLLATQAALAVVLVAGAALFVRSLQHVAKLPFGVDVDRVIVASIAHASAGLTNSQAKDLHLRFAERVRTVPGVTAAAVSIAHSFGLGWGTRVFVSGRNVVPPSVRQGFSQYAVTPDYFKVMGVPLRSGRLFDERDREGSALVAILNETAATTFWPRGDAIGQCVQVGADTMPCTTIVGIVANARRQSVVEGPIPQIYRPLMQLPAAVTDGTVSFFGYTLLVRAERSPATLVEPIRRVIQATSPNVPYADVRPLSDQFGRQTRAWTLGATMFTIFGALALALAVVGLYSVVVVTLAQRRHEYGVRLALGATGRELVRLTATRGVAPALAGIGAGLAITVAASPLLKDLLFQTSPRDPFVLIAVTALLVGAAIAASLVPGLRAAKTDPMIALRAER
jgi:predicted permease